MLNCAVCNKEVPDEESVVCCSTFGASTFRYCKDCYTNGLEPYKHMVHYISCAGNFPDDINKSYQVIVRNILQKMNISEDKFIKDVAEFNSKYD